MSSQAKPSIVFAHGIWADGSCFNKVIPPLQAEGYEVASAQYGLDTNEDDVAATLRTLGRVSSPAILVGHSYGGSVITAADTDDRVAGLVYICALAPDETETSQGQQDKFPVTDVFAHVELPLLGELSQSTAVPAGCRRLRARSDPNPGELTQRYIALRIRDMTAPC
jgi:pimeloyl-ACP methyl ester carboxylesterase